MSLDPVQLREMVIRPTLDQLGMYSAAAENLMAGTAAVESGLIYLRQHRGGPALGLWQIEPATHADLWNTYFPSRADLRQAVVMLSAIGLADELDQQLATNLCYACAIARVIYWRRPEPLPKANDIEGLGAYYKQWYNTPRGAGTIQKFIEQYKIVRAGHRNGAEP